MVVDTNNSECFPRRIIYDIGIKVKEILITGGAGFIGSHLCQKLLDDGNRLTVVDDESTGTRSNLEQLLDHYKFEFFIKSDDFFSIIKM